MPKIAIGLYDRLYNVATADLLAHEQSRLRTKLQPLIVEDSHDHLARYLAEVLRYALRACEQSAEQRLDKQVALCRSVLQLLAEEAPVLDVASLALHQPASRLMSVQPDYGKAGTDVPHPGSPLSFACLLTGTGGDPSLVSQLALEFASADEVNILCSFIRWTGVRVLMDALTAFAGREGTRLRVLTTTYMGASEEKAITFLANLPNAEVRISYNHQVTRLHAKAYQFCRTTGFGSAYIGSANLTAAALTDGVEWNLKISQAEQDYLWQKISGTFESYWNDSEFEPYKSGQNERLRQALAMANARDCVADDVQPLFDLTPHAYQQEILDRIDHERSVLGRKWQLIVSATGTGKTMVAAFDFNRWLSSWLNSGAQRNPRFMFIAHREEILLQSLKQFRNVLKNHNFGDVWTSNNRPTQTDNLFVSIQTFRTGELEKVFAADHFDYIVVDEFHHAAASSYQDLLNHVKPQVLLALTATPERHDGLDVLHYFEGHATAQIRLPDAINRKQLAPFQYFCITDVVDLSGVEWKRGGYSVYELESLYVANQDRNQLIMRKVRELLVSPRAAKGLGFCVSKAHAAAMAMTFNENGLPALNLDSDTPMAERREVLSRLNRGDLSFVFTVDLFNEGIDLPAIDTVLFLRPTQSLTVFLQQLGRGLRLSSGKECLTVLDFIGQAHKNYRFEQKFRALLSQTSYSIAREIAAGFPHLPAGCSIQMEKIAREHILRSIEASLRHAREQWILRARTFEEETGQRLTLQNFLEHYDITPSDIYRRTTWSAILAAAGKIEPYHSADEDKLRKGFMRCLHVNDANRVEAGMRVAEAGGPETYDRTSAEMVLVSVWGADRPKDFELGRARLLANEQLCAEFRELLAYNLVHADTSSKEVVLPEAPSLLLHARYTREEALLALGVSSLKKQKAFREGTLHIPTLKLDAFFITLNKNEREFSPTTLYEDYAISRDLFHWQSQSGTADTSRTAERYINHQSLGYRIILFVRNERKLQNGLSEPFYCMGQVNYVSHTGSKPVSFTWRLKTPMPAHLLRKTARMVVA